MVEPTLLALNNAGFKTTQRADDLNTKLMGLLGLKSRYEPARLAIARSLSIRAPPPEVGDEEEDGKIIVGQNLFGDDLAVWVALVVEHSQRENASVRDVQELVRRHWGRGIDLLMTEWEQCSGDFDRFVLQLAGRSGVREGGKIRTVRHSADGEFVPRAVPVELSLGDPGIDVATQQPVKWLLNGRGNSPHVAVMGTLGTGKTRLAVNMMRQVRELSGCPVLLFDMAKGDLAADEELAREIGAEVISAPRSPVPLDVLHIADRNPTEITNAAMRFRESFQLVTQSRPGGAQLDSLREAAQRALTASPVVRFKDVRDKLREVYAEKKRKDDTVTSTFNDLTAWELFEPRFKPAEFFQRSWIINVAEATETAQRLIVFLVLDALYAHCRSLPDSELDDQHHRAMRLVVGIDEARKVLGYGHPSLIGLVRESRSKGMTLFLISQSPDDYDAEDENFLENIGLGLSFRTNAMRPAALRAVLGEAVDLGGLPNGVAVTRLPGRPGITRVKTWEQR